MYFDFDDLRPDTPTLPSSISRREGVLLSIIAHMAFVILVLVWPMLPFVRAMEARQQAALEARQAKLLEEQRKHQRFVFVEPSIDVETKMPKVLAELSDRNRRKTSVERAPAPKNNLPFSRGNSPERVESPGAPSPRHQRGAEETARAKPEPPAPQATPDPGAVVLPEAPAAPPARPEEPRPRPGPSAGILSDAIRNVQRYAQGETLQNQQGGGDAGPSIQFDTKGVEFGPWLRRFVAQIRSNWFVPYAAMSLRGHVVLTFNVHKDGRITDLQVLRPSSVDAFTNSAFNAIRSSNPTQPLPPEYPDEQAFFTVTFYFNETPPDGGGQ